MYLEEMESLIFPYLGVCVRLPGPAVAVRKDAGPG